MIGSGKGEDSQVLDWPEDILNVPISIGDIDVSVAIATRFLDEAATRPIVHKCGEYHGTANDVMVTVSCLEEGEGADIEGYTGYAIYAQFHGDVANQDAAICQMDIVLYDSTLF